MSEKLLATSPTLATAEPALFAQLQAVEALPLEQRAAAVQANGALIKALLAWVMANPGQATAWVMYILALFGVKIPTPPLPVTPQ